MTKPDSDRKVQELGIFHDVAKALTSSLDLDSILQTIMEKMAEYFRPDNWSLLMVDEERDELYFAIAVGKASEALKNVRLKVGEGIAGWVAKHGERADCARRLHRSSVRQAHRRNDPVGDALDHLRAAALQVASAGRDSTGQRATWNTLPIRNHFFCNRFVTMPPSPSKMRARSRRFRNSTITDDCTGLYNARHLYKTLETEVYRSARYGYEFTVVFIDLDHFKQVNDTHGHLVGSKLLTEIGYLIKAQLRLIDYAFRYGGDEFVVLLPQTGKDAALVVAKRLRDSLRTSMFCQEEGLNLNVRASMGVATYPHDAKTPARHHPPGG